MTDARGTCPVCGTGFTMSETTVSPKDCGCGPVPCGHSWHYEHVRCYRSRPVPELKMFDFPLWEGIELHVTAVSDGRLLTARVERTS